MRAPPGRRAGAPPRRGPPADPGGSRRIPVDPSDPHRHFQVLISMWGATGGNTTPQQEASPSIGLDLGVQPMRPALLQGPVGSANEHGPGAVLRRALKGSQPITGRRCGPRPQVRRPWLWRRGGPLCLSGPSRGSVKRGSGESQVLTRASLLGVAASPPWGPSVAGGESQGASSRTLGFRIFCFYPVSPLGRQGAPRTLSWPLPSRGPPGGQHRGPASCSPSRCNKNK